MGELDSGRGLKSFASANGRRFGFDLFDGVGGSFADVPIVALQLPTEQRKRSFSRRTRRRQAINGGLRLSGFRSDQIHQGRLRGLICRFDLENCLSHFSHALMFILGLQPISQFRKAGFWSQTHILQSFRDFQPCFHVGSVESLEKKRTSGLCVCAGPSQHYAMASLSKSRMVGDLAHNDRQGIRIRGRECQQPGGGVKFRVGIFGF